MKQCFGYLRVSTTKQGDGVSLDAQKAFILGYAEQNELTISRWFEEKETAAKQGRPAFNAMVRGIKRGQAEGFVAHKIDRSARNFADWARIGDLSDAGYEVHFAAETLDFRSRGGRLSADMQVVLATDFIRNLRDEVKKGIDGRLKQGLYPFKAPVGYLDNGKGAVKTLDPERARLVRELFELYATGNHSIRTVQAEMTKRGLTNCNGRSPSKPLIETALSNPFYCGIIRIKVTGKTYQGIHEPLIPVALFQRVQDVKSGKAGKKVTRHNHRYRGLFQCAGCGRSMIPERQKGRVYYRCQTKACPTTTAREDALETAVFELMAGLRLSEPAIQRLTKEVAKWVKDQGHSEQEELQRQQRLAQIDQRLENLTDALIDKHIDHDAYNTRRQTLLLEKQNLEEQGAKVTSRHDAGEQVQRFLELAKSLAPYYRSLNPSEKRAFVEITLSNRNVRGKSIELEPSDWLEPVQSVVSVGNGALTRPNSRSGQELKAEQIEALVTAAYSAEVEAFLARKDQGRGLTEPSSTDPTCTPAPMPEQPPFNAENL